MFSKVKNLSWSIPAAALLLGSVVLVGCNKEDEKAPPMPSSNPPTMPPNAPTLPPTTKPTDLSLPSTPKLPEVPSIPGTPTTGPAADPAAAAGSADTEAKGLIAKAQDAIKDKKWDDAEAIIKQLEALQSKLSPDMQKQVEALKQALTAGKGLGGLKLPGTPDIK